MNRYTEDPNPNPLPLAVAVCDGDQGRVARLLDDGEPINKRDYKGRSALVLALLSRESEIARLLLERGADPNLHDAEGRFPLHLALDLGDETLVTKLLEGGARPDVQDRKGRTPLHTFAQRGVHEAVERFLRQRANPAPQDRKGNTPLHLATREGRLQAARALLEAGAPVDVENEDQDTPLLLAVRAEHPDMVALLLDHGARDDRKCRGGKAGVDLAYAAGNLEIVGLLKGSEVRDRLERGKREAMEHRIDEATCDALDQRLADLRSTIEPMRHDPPFDVNRFLTVFDRVHLQPGYVLDYYHDHIDRPPDPTWARLLDSDASPAVFTRRADESHAEAAHRASALRWRRDHLMDHLEFERSPEGYLQWAVFSVAVHQFYLCWHANYNDRRFMLTRAALELVIAELEPPPTDSNSPLDKFMRVSLKNPGGSPLPDAHKQTLRALDPTPWVKVAGDLGEVRALTFSKWGGFAWHHHRLRWPHHVDGTSLETVVEYQCGILF